MNVVFAYNFGAEIVLVTSTVQ